MLSPQTNAHRTVLDLGGFWDFQIDPEGQGEAAGWMSGLPSPVPMAVPGSWNELRSEHRDYLDDAWYCRTFQVPQRLFEERLILRFDAVNYAAFVWLNGVALGLHEGGFLPFEFDITDQASQGDNLLVVRVNCTLRLDRIPTGGGEDGPFSGFMRGHPQTNFDFFPYAGIQRPVRICSLPRLSIQELSVHTGFAVSGSGSNDGWVQVSCGVEGTEAGEVEVRLLDEEVQVAGAVIRVDEQVAAGRLHVPSARLWGPEDPHLYRCEFTLRDASGRETDQYRLNVGIRTVTVQGSQLLLNDEPVFLKGFGKHEDFPILGRSLNLPLIVKDGALLEWIGANSYRTSHYPYAEEAIEYADRAGLLIINEIPAVGLMFGDDLKLHETQLQVCKRHLADLIARDANHPSVIMWSVANEPMPADFMRRFQGQRPDPQADVPGTRFFSELIEHGRSLDSSRPFTLAGVMGGPVPWLALCDVVLINRYWGWYVMGGQRGQARAALERELDSLHGSLDKPILISEFGADAIAGHHSLPSEMFSEEYQAEILEDYLAVAAERDFVVGLHVWNFADFKTGQGAMRPGALNHKGVFTRERRPKMAAHLLRERWGPQS